MNISKKQILILCLVTLILAGHILYWTYKFGYKDGYRTARYIATNDLVQIKICLDSLKKNINAGVSLDKLNHEIYIIQDWTYAARNNLHQQQP